MTNNKKTLITENTNYQSTNVWL